MDDGSSQNFLKTLKSEWKLLWTSIKEDESLEIGSLDEVKLPQVESLFKDLSDERHNLNVQLEELKNEIEVIETQRLNLQASGSLAETLEKHLEHLHSQGQRLQAELEELNECLEEARNLTRQEQADSFT